MIGEFLIARHLAGELKSRGKIGFREPGVILQNHFLGITGGQRPQNHGDENARPPDHGFAMANFRMGRLWRQRQFADFARICRIIHRFWVKNPSFALAARNSQNTLLGL